MRLPDTEHTRRPWRIHEITPDFRLEDVWSYRTPGAGPDDFPAMLDALRAAGGLNENPAVVRFLFAVRWKLGAMFGWDKTGQGLERRVKSLCERLPRDLRQDGAGEAVPNTPFSMVYELHDECAIELANKTVHAISHLGWVPTDNGDYELRMAAMVRPNGLLGRLYMAAIKPFRYLIIYPALTRKWERAWRCPGQSARIQRQHHRQPGPFHNPEMVVPPAVTRCRPAAHGAITRKERPADQVGWQAYRLLWNRAHTGRPGGGGRRMPRRSMVQRGAVGK